MNSDASFLNIGVISVIVSIDNALLAGLFTSGSNKAERRALLILTGFALAFAQIGLSAGVEQLLSQPLFRVAALVLLVWMSVRTMLWSPTLSRGRSGIRRLFRVFVLTLLGNIDNMIWLGSELHKDYFALIFHSLVSIPLFVLVANFLSEQTERHRWILFLGSGMMAWAASAIFLETTIGQTLRLTAPAWLVKLAFASLIVLCGVGVRTLFVRPIQRVR